MKKSLLFFLVNFALIAFFTTDAKAASCSFNVSPEAANINRDSGPITISVSSPDLIDGSYNLYLGLLSKKVTFSGGSSTPATFQPFNGGWPPGKMTIEFKNNSEACQKANFNIKEVPAQKSCQTRIEPPSINPDTSINIYADNIKEGNYDILINDQLKFNNNLGPSNNGFSLGKLPRGSYKLDIKNSCGVLGAGCAGGNYRTQCPSTQFSVLPRGVSGPSTGAGAGAGTTKPLDLRFCQEIPGQIRIDTAIGCIPINTSTDFIAWLLGWFIGIAGGIAFLLLLWSGFQIMTASGNPDQVRAGKEQLTAAISGLLFIIFSIFLLKLIGVNILNIPGLS